MKTKELENWLALVFVLGVGVMLLTILVAQVYKYTRCAP